MVLPAHDLWSHITWSAAGILFIFGIPNSSYAEVCNSDVSFVIEYQIFRLDVPVDYTIIMKIFQTMDDTGCEELGLFLSKPPMLADMVSKVSPA